MNYYINLSSWNLLESFVTESLSPFSFYRARGFGNNLSRYLDGASERTNYLILSTKRTRSDYSLKIDDTILDMQCLAPVIKSKSLFTYNKTIFYKKGHVWFEFSSKELLDAMVAESQILFEVKCIGKYQSEFLVTSDKTEVLSIDKIANTISFQQSEFIEQDALFDKLKGAIVSYTNAIAFTTDNHSQELNRQLRELKNAFAGLNTQIMVSDSSVPNLQIYIDLIAKSRQLFNRVIDTQTYLFDILDQQLVEIDKIASLRANEFAFSHAENSDERRTRLQEQIRIKGQELSAMGAENRLSDLRSELEGIKKQEKENGEEKGKTREYFKKGTIEYKRKQFLKEEIKKYENDNSEYKDIKQQIAELKQQLSDLDMNSSKYDVALGALFARVSDIMNDLIRKAEISNKPNLKVDYACFSFQFPFSIITNMPTPSVAEQDFLRIIFYETLMRTERILSDEAILDLITTSSNKFKELESSTTIEGKQIIETLREFWAYKHNRRMTFGIPDNLKILKSLMAFFVKPYGFDQMERYVQNKHIENKEYGFMLRGAFIGYSAIPKTFTERIYSNERLYTPLDDFLIKMHKQVESQYPCGLTRKNKRG